VPVLAGAVAVLAGVVPAEVPAVADVLLLDELELELELLEVVLAAALATPLVGTLKLGAPAVLVVPVVPPPQPATASPSKTAMVPAVTAGRWRR
jgi:hypothetical protein